MKRILVTALLFLTVTALAQEQQQPAQSGESTIPRDELTAGIARDLHAIGRVADLAKDIGDERQVLLAIVDDDIHDLRMPREDGTYQWASLQREEGGRVSDEKTIEYVFTEKELRYVTITGPNGYRVEVAVPRKRGTFSANNRVWVRNVLVDSTGFDGKTQHHEIPVNAWVNPGDATGVALPEIGKSVKATAELGVESGKKQAVAEVSLVEAKLVDDPNSPYFPAAKRMLQIREILTAKDLNRGYLKNTVDEALLSLPDELEKRVAAQEEAARVRKLMIESGTTTGSLSVGDATPDVVNALAEIARMMRGTLQEQADARTKLDALIATLQPPKV